MTRRTPSSSRCLLQCGQVVLDLGAAPGAWSRYARVKVGLQGQVLKPGCGAPIKVFQGAGFQELTVAARRQFRSVRLLKPAAACARSAGIYLLASGLRLV
jgi:23S rRNA U2552 (ribose-2'-O)-methylase RlmE/FtsJ